MINNSMILYAGSCEPYSQQTCRNLGAKLGFKLGHGAYDFIGDYGTKGCYSYKTGEYKGALFYGQGGTKDEKSIPLDKSSNIFRPEGYDCKSEGKCFSDIIGSLVKC